MARDVLLEFPDKSRHLRYSVNALSDLEQHLGTGLAGMLMTGRMGMGMIRGLLWAGLKHEDKRLTPAGAGELMQAWLDNGGELERLGDLIKEALALAGLVEKVEDEKEGAPTGSPPPAPSASTSVS